MEQIAEWLANLGMSSTPNALLKMGSVSQLSAICPIKTRPPSMANQRSFDHAHQ
jgi:hypothetical protein